MTSSYVGRLVLVATLLTTGNATSIFANAQHDGKQIDGDVNYRLPAICDLLLVTGHDAAAANRLKPEAEADDAASATKRKWGENTMSTWGKRSAAEMEESNSVLAACERLLHRAAAMASADNTKRRWGDDSMQAWGKRDGGAPAAGALRGELGDRVEGPQRRGWGDKEMHSWGKRSLDGEEILAGDKRPWGEKDMSAWGKRVFGGPEQKRKWGENSMDAWGKRLAGPIGQELQSRGRIQETKRSIRSPKPVRQRLRVTGEGGPKRNWEMNTMKVWG